MAFNERHSHTFRLVSPAGSMSIPIPIRHWLLNLLFVFEFASFALNIFDCARCATTPIAIGDRVRSNKLAVGAS